MRALKTALRKYIASHKATISTIWATAVTGACGAAYTCLQEGKFDMKAVGIGAAIAVLGLLAGVGKSPSTPSAAPPSAAPADTPPSATTTQ